MNEKKKKILDKNTPPMDGSQLENTVTLWQR